MFNVLAETKHITIVSLEHMGHAYYTVYRKDDRGNTLGWNKCYEKAAAFQMARSFLLN